MSCLQLYQTPRSGLYVNGTGKTKVETVTVLGVYIERREIFYLITGSRSSADGAHPRLVEGRYVDLYIEPGP